jgi:hypothetical protein
MAGPGDLVVLLPTDVSAIWSLVTGFTSKRGAPRLEASDAGLHV